MEARRSELKDREQKPLRSLLEYQIDPEGQACGAWTWEFLHDIDPRCNPVRVFVAPTATANDVMQALAIIIDEIGTGRPAHSADNARLIWEYQKARFRPVPAGYVRDDEARDDQPF